MDVPVGRVKDPRALAYIVDSLRPGTTIHRRVEVSNTSSDPQHVDLYAGAATIEGNTFTASVGRSGNELSGWVSLELASIDLPANTRKPVWVTIVVPPTASKGERYAAIYAQIAKPPDAGSNVGQTSRVGIRVYLDVGPGGEAATDFRIEGMTVDRAVGQWPVVTAHVHNTGGRAVDLSGSLSLSSSDAAVRAGPFKATTGVTILPGGTGQVSVLVDKALVAGDWEADLTLVSGTVERKASATITIPGPVSAKPASMWSKLSPKVSVGGGLALVVFLGFLAWYLIRGRTAARVRRNRST
jgi:hypothetical protein